MQLFESLSQLLYLIQFNSKSPYDSRQVLD